MIKKIFEQRLLSIFDNLKTWSDHNQLKEESVSSHSYKVIIFTKAILEEILPYELCNKGDLLFKAHCVDYAIFHDWDEIYIKRDLSHTFKYNSTNGEELRKQIDFFVFKEVDEKIGNTFSQGEFKEIILRSKQNVKLLVKIADWLAMYHKCNIELQLGNKTFEELSTKCLNGLQESIKAFEQTNIAKRNFLGTIIYDLQQLQTKSE